MTGTVRYFDCDRRGYTQPAEISGEILADSSKFVTVDTHDRTVLIPVENTIHIRFDKESTL